MLPKRMMISAEKVKRRPAAYRVGLCGAV